MNSDLTAELRHLACDVNHNGDYACYCGEPPNVTIRSLAAQAARTIEARPLDASMMRRDPPAPAVTVAPQVQRVMTLPALAELPVRSVATAPIPHVVPVHRGDFAFVTDVNEHECAALQRLLASGEKARLLVEYLHPNGAHAELTEDKRYEVCNLLAAVYQASREP